MRVMRKRPMRMPSRVDTFELRSLLHKRALHIRKDAGMTHAKAVRSRHVSFEISSAKKSRMLQKRRGNDSWECRRKWTRLLRGAVKESIYIHIIYLHIYRVYDIESMYIHISGVYTYTYISSLYIYIYIYIEWTHLF